MFLRRNITLPSCLHGKSALRKTPATRAGWSRQSSTLRENPKNAFKTSTAGELPLIAPSHQPNGDDIDPIRRPWKEAVANISSGSTENEIWHTAELHNIPDKLAISTDAATDVQLHDKFVPLAGEQGGNFVEEANDICLETRITEREFRDWWLAWKYFWDTIQNDRRGKGAQRTPMFNAHRNFARAFVSQLDAKGLREKWSRLTLRSKLNVTPMLLAGSLFCSPAQALFVLANTSYSWGDFTIRMRCLLYLHTSALQQVANAPELLKAFKAELAKCISPEIWGSTHMVKAHLEMLLYWSDPDECDMIIRAVQERYPFAPNELFTQILIKHARLGDVDDFLKLLPKFPPNYFRDCEHGVKEQLKHLLRRDTVVTSETGTNFKILPELFKFGFEPDREIYNIVLQNALKEDFYVVAWDLYRYLHDRDIEIWTKSYPKLMRSAITQRDIQALDQIMTDIHTSARLSSKPALITYTMNVVRITSFASLETNPSEAMTRVMKLYDEKWNRRGLQPFQILGSVGKPSHQHPLPHAPSPSIAFTLWSYIQVQRSEQVVNRLWQRITDLLHYGDQTTAKVLRRETVYNGFILFYSRKLGTLVRALKVIQYMLDQGVCEPSPRTWSLLVCGFLRHHQMDQAESVIRMMQRRGMKLDKIDEERIPHDYTLADLKSRVESVLDEMQFPRDLEEWLEESDEEVALPEARIEAEVAEDLSRYESGLTGGGEQP